MRQLEDDIYILKRLKHHYTVKYVGSYTNPTNLVGLIMIQLLIRTSLGIWTLLIMAVVFNYKRSLGAWPAGSSIFTNQGSNTRTSSRAISSSIMGIFYSRILDSRLNFLCQAAI